MCVFQIGLSEAIQQYPYSLGIDDTSVAFFVYLNQANFIYC